jgi:hypothetical protein
MSLAAPILDLRKRTFTFLLACLIYCMAIATHCFARDNTDQPLYVGSLACKTCHEKEYANFTAYAKKNNSYESIERLRKGLNEDDLKKCYACHTTGYGKLGGFVSLEKTPHLKNAGCEVCHGPGSIHIQDAKPASIIGSPPITVCHQCHTSERIKAFKFTPLIHGGAH